LVPLLAMLAHSMDYRVRTQAADGQGGLAFLLSDHRRPIWNAALELIAERPWAGHGWDEELVGARLAERLPNDPWLKTYVRQAHNMSLNAALQWGVPGALLQGLFYLVLFAAFLKPALHAREPLSAAAASAGMALVAGYVMRNMVDDFTTRHLALMFGAAGGMLLGLACRRAKPKATIR
jgi:O-antigen ligase